MDIRNHPNLIKNQLSLTSPYQFQVLTAAYLNQVVEIFTRAFCRSEPMTHYLQMDEHKYKIFAKSVTEKAIEDGLSIIALDGEKVIACALNEDLTLPGPVPYFDPKFDYILALLEKLGDNFFSGKTFPKNHIVHLFITAVDEAYRHRGLSTQVNFRAMDLAALHGFKFMYCELTHRFNEFGIIHHLKNPKRTIGKIVYKDFMVNGLHPFSNLSGEAHSFLWAIQEHAKLIYEEKQQLQV